MDPVSDVPDLLAPALRVLFVGINPGRRSAAARAHFANPRNDFWRLLHESGLTPELLGRRGSAGAGPRPGHHERGLPDDARLGRPAGRRLRGRRGPPGAAGVTLRPRILAFVGKEAYRGAVR